MDKILDSIVEWLKEVLVGGIVSNLSGMFDSVNQQVGDIAGQVGATPQAWNGSIYNMIRSLSDISPENKEWAKAEPVPNDFDAWNNKKTLEYSCNKAHPGLINLFVNRFRKEQELEKEKKPSVLKKLHEAKADVPKKSPSKTKEAEL